MKPEDENEEYDNEELDDEEYDLEEDNYEDSNLLALLEQCKRDFKIAFNQDK
mgnify:CR=1 FL=1